MIVAGEASGEMHAAGVAEALSRLRPDLGLVGVGGGRMESAGVALLERTDRCSAGSANASPAAASRPSS